MFLIFRIIISSDNFLTYVNIVATVSAAIEISFVFLHEHFFMNNDNN